jgi:high-affinity nickel-transport protein
MRPVLRTLFNDAAGNTRGKVLGIYSLLLAVFNAAAWLWAIVAFRHFPVLLGTAFLAYSFGLRHAVDADHIAAIDNVTRKLMQEGKRPVAVGLMFSLGHSTIVLLGSVASPGHPGAAAPYVCGQGNRRRRRHAGFHLFLFGIAAVNLVVLRYHLANVHQGSRGRALR